jgi:hypothetical protein
VIDFPRRGAIASGALVLALLVSRAAWGQVRGIPVEVAGIPRGIGMAGEVGFPGDALGGGTAYGATALAGLGPLDLTASIAVHDRSASSSITSYGGAVGVQVVGGPVTPLSLTMQAGYGYWKTNGTGVSHVPLGLGIALAIPIPGIAISPWLMPRADLTIASAGGASSTDTRFAISGGIDVTLLNGLGVRASYDRIAAAGPDPSTLAVGIHYIFFKAPGR